MKVQARLNRYRRSAQKVREIFPVIKGLNAMDALLQLEYSKRGDALDIKKLLESAVANAINNFKLKKEDLFVENILAEEGKTMKRWRPRAYGRAARILKRTCDIIITLEDKNQDAEEGAEQEDPSIDKEKETKEAKKPAIEKKKLVEDKKDSSDVKKASKEVETKKKEDK
ncbi:50S ribosomal protein L22 [bacterium]|jgi:large subunit ribosomal protein L22|nr:50S ribosomal protein L22 [bacterium]MBT4251541.1 50S ribosomal protein L22 [bacterium]MBT4597803.1 50S ribosomal protein L22 [bacterium]MBT6753527.1 50S ribosomal protein L22 [bacterium]MBT7037745.1 50S ribosomal protein L22 [bacterium]